MWRLARSDEDDAVVAMCLAYYREDPGFAAVTEAQIRRTLLFLRSQPARGSTVVLEVDGAVVGYALLIAFWSNEYGGEACDIDELFVLPRYRNRGFGSALFSAIERGAIGNPSAVAMMLGVTPRNADAKRLYERLGFSVTATGLARLIRR